jgi:hypothetical protein
MRIIPRDCVLLLLLCASACGGTSTKPSPVTTVYGSWRNANSNTQSLTRATIETQGTSLVAHMWASCVPECDWGTLSVPLSSVVNNSFSLVWNQGFVIRTQEIGLQPDGQLKVFTRSHYIDASGRVDNEVTDMFVKQ